MFKFFRNVAPVGGYLACVSAVAGLMVNEEMSLRKTEDKYRQKGLATQRVRKPYEGDVYSYDASFQRHRAYHDVVEVTSSPSPK